MHEKTVFELRGSKVRIALPAGWRPVRDLYGIPLTLLSADHSGGNAGLVEDNEARRTILSVIPTGARGVELVAEGLKRDQAGYFDSKVRDLEELGARVQDRIPYRYDSLRSGSEPNLVSGIHRIGVRYSTDQRRFLELSHYLVCNTEIYLLKALIHVEDEPADSKLIEEAVRSFECR